MNSITQSRTSLKEHTVLVVGSEATGRFSLANRFAYDRFSEQKDLSEGSFKKQCLVDNKLSQIALSILNPTDPNPEETVKSADGFIFVYSITRRESFERLPEYSQHILRIKQQVVPMVIVGTKSDLEFHREVSYEEARDLAKQFGCPFHEICSKIGINVDEAICDLVREIRKPNPDERLRQAIKRGSVSGKSSAGGCIIT